MQPVTRCELCQRVVSKTTKHHFIPKTRHKNKRNKKNFDRQEIHERVGWFCAPCHKNVHAVLTEKELERGFNTLELLTAHPEVAKFTEWVRKKPDGHIAVHSSNGKNKERIRIRGVF